jgi:hypothetical protein
MDILISPLLFAFFGVMMFIGAIRYEQSYDKVATWWKWSFAPIAVAVLLGLQRVAFLTSFAYINTVITRKLLWSHWVSLFLPILCVASIILYRWMKTKNEDRRVY